MTTAWLIRAGQTLLGGALEPGIDVLVVDGIVAAVGPQLPAPGDAVIVTGPDGVLAPGFVDLHVHAVGGCGVVDAARADLPGMARGLAAQGVTSFLATTVASPIAELESLVRAAVEPSPGGARCVGVHLEGPWLNPDRAGAQPVEHFTLPSERDLARLLDSGPVRLLTLAPELPGAGAVIAAAVARDVVVALGHSDATYAETLAAVEAGASHITHCFNAMRPFHHREPGIAGAALELSGLSVEVIADGVHVDPTAVRILWQARGRHSLCFVSDGVGGVSGLTTDGTAVRRDDGRLAGSTTGLDAAVRNGVAWGIPLADALTMASTTPAGVLGSSHLSTIAAGNLADLVLLDAALGVRATWVGGEQVHG